MRWWTALKISWLMLQKPFSFFFLLRWWCCWLSNSHSVSPVTSAVFTMRSALLYQAIEWANWFFSIPFYDTHTGGVSFDVTSCESSYQWSLFSWCHYMPRLIGHNTRRQKCLTRSASAQTGEKMSFRMSMRNPKTSTNVETSKQTRQTDRCKKHREAREIIGWIMLTSSRIGERATQNQPKARPCF